MKCLMCNCSLIKSDDVRILWEHPHTSCELKQKDNVDLRFYKFDIVCYPSNFKITEGELLIVFSVCSSDDDWYMVCTTDLNGNVHRHDYEPFCVRQHKSSQEVFDKFLLEKIREMKKRVKLIAFEN